MTKEKSPRELYHYHFMKAMKSVPQSPNQMHHRAEMEKHKKKMGKTFINQVAPKRMAKFDRKIGEDAPANAAGGGQVAGIGVGDQGEPGIKKSKKFKKGELMPFYAFIKRKTK